MLPSSNSKSDEDNCKLPKRKKEIRGKNTVKYEKRMNIELIMVASIM